MTFTQAIANLARGEGASNSAASILAALQELGNPLADLSLATDYANITATPSDVLTTGAIAFSGGDVYGIAWGNVSIANNDSNASPVGLVDDTAIGVFQIYLDGVAQNHARADVQGPLSLIGASWQFGGTAGFVIVFKLAPAAGNHTIALKGALAAVPTAGASLSCPALSGPSVYGARLRLYQL